MAVVTVTGKLSDFSGVVFPAGVVPELWFRPKESALSPSGVLLAGVESKATLNVATGAWSVQLENAAGVRYTPFVRWILNPAESLPEMRAWGRAEWADFWFHPGGGGGSLGTLIDRDFSQFIAFYFGPISEPPPAGFRGYWEVQAEPGREDSDDPFIGDVRRVYGG